MLDRFLEDLSWRVLGGVGERESGWLADPEWRMLMSFSLDTSGGK